ncbi:MAG: 3-methyl-2-oxobutanoate hydroxymethyltransferase [Exilibacterium sp.]
MQKQKRVMVPDVVKRKGTEKLVMLTAYDFTMARLLDEQVDMLLVGDSLGCVVQGNDNTLGVTLDQMVYHATMVSRAARHALVVGDLPFGSYQAGSEDALRSAMRMVKEAGVGAVKLEGGGRVCESIATIVEAGIPVMAHLGLTPQSFHALGGNRVQGKNLEDAQRLIDAAQAVERAGAFALVLEAIPAPLAREITASVAIPTIGIGAGADCDGQVLVANDMLGLNSSRAPMQFNKEYCVLRDMIAGAVNQYAKEVRKGAFPDAEHSYLAERTRQPRLSRI